MDNICPEGTEYQSVTYPNGESLGRNFHIRRSKRIRKSQQWYNPGFGAARKWKNEADTSIVYMIPDGDLNRNVYTDDILSLLDHYDAEYCMDTPPTSHTKYSYVQKSQIHDLDTPTFMEALSGENAEKYFEAMYDEIQGIVRRDTC